MAKRIWVDPPSFFRCSASITLKDGSKAQCGRWQNNDVRSAGRLLCSQHNDMWLRGRLVEWRTPKPKKDA